MSWIDVWCERWLAWIFPERCVACERHAGSLCAGCRRTLEWYDEPPPMLLAAQQATHIAYVYNHTMRQIVHRLKYRRERRVARLAGTLIAQRVPECLTPGSAFVPVPLHATRLARRGFNQAALLAGALAGISRGRLLDQLVRQRDTPPQAHLDARERQANVADAFAWRGIPPPAHVILVDDVLTTGATMHACGEALRAAGARTITGLALARSRSPRQPSS
ncbi:MAG: ComF family protein [Chloroflexi bacterium]|nr:ComF family protein [Chloroflexota bacterium]